MTNGTSAEAHLSDFVEKILNPARLASLRRLGLLDTPAEEAFDRLGELASKVLRAPVALVSLVDDSRQFFKSCRGLPEPWATWRQTPLSHSFCKHVVATAEPLIITDAREHPFLRDNLAVTELGVIAYLGIPLVTSDGSAIGSFCVIDSTPRSWSEDEIRYMTILAGCAMTEVELRSEVLHGRELNIELARANEDLEAFNRSVAHDLRSPLQGVVGYAELLRASLGEGRLDDQEKEDFEALLASARRMQAIIDDLYQLSRVSQTPLAPQPVSLREVSQAIVDDLRRRDPARRLEIAIHIDEPVSADPGLLAIVLRNLLENAWKFTARLPEAYLEIGETRGEASSAERIFFVRDNGVGFDGEAQGRLFHPFVRLPSAHDFPGTGVGLSTVRRIIERHGGRIWAEGTPGRGATFWFALPSGKTAEPVGAQREAGPCG